MVRIDMRKTIMIAALVLSTGAFAKVSFDRVKNVFSYVQNTAGYHVRLKYDNDPNANAWNELGTITVTQGMLDLLNTDDDIAMLLGHEISHYANEDYRFENATYQELRADGKGYYYCKKMGYKKCLGFVKKMIKEFGNEPEDGVHPQWIIRYNKLKNK